MLGAITYRFLGHSRGDPSAYRDKTEEEQWKRRDPLVLTGHRIVELDPTVSVQIEAAEYEIREELRKAVEDAEASPPATIDEVLAGVFATPLGGIQ